MKTQFKLQKIVWSSAIAISLLLMSVLANSATLDLSNVPLISSATTVEVRPNVLFILDNSGSMDRGYMPDDVSNFSGDYGYKSSQCNGVAYDPTITYLPPIKANKSEAYDNSNFTAAWDDGFATGSTTNLNNSYYYLYTGSVTDKDFSNTGSTFYTQCNTSEGSATSVFTKVVLSTTKTSIITISGSNSTSVSSIKVNGVEILSATTSASTTSSTVASRIAANISSSGFSATSSGSQVTITGPTSATGYTPVVTKSGSMTFSINPFAITDTTKLQNYANWYSYYRTRMLMMKTSAGFAFASLNEKYRVGLMKINSSDTLVQELGTFEGTQRDEWYSRFYSQEANGFTPLREALSNAGLYYAGKMSNTTDPVQYSCQQNFTILSTDGYWNNNAGFKLNGDAVGNQDGLEDRPMNDGAVSVDGYTYTYTRYTYYKQKNSCNSGKNIYKQPQTGTCFSASATSGCSPSNWANTGSATIETSCTNKSTPGNSTPVKSGTPVADTIASGGTTDTLADVAEYYYKTDLRDSSLGNCGSSDDLCENNVFSSSTDPNKNQHMTTFTLGLGANGLMKYSSTYDTDTSGDYLSVKLGLTASSSLCTWQTADTTCNWPEPTSDDPTGIDDLWHAAVNGRGSYFSASNPTSLSQGLSSALLGIDTRKGSAAAASSTTLNPVSGDNKAFFSSFVTSVWTGNLEARSINTDTGVISKNALWCVEDVVADSCATVPVAQTIGDTTIYNCELPTTGVCADGVVGYSGNATSGDLFCKVPVATACVGTMNPSITNPRVSASSDTRTIYTSSFNSGANKYELVNFDASFATANPGYFNAATLAGLSQWAALDSTQQAKAVGANLVNYLRGQYGFDKRIANLTTVDNRLYRQRDTVLGDTLESVPSYMGPPVFSYQYPGYAAFKSSQASRAGTVYIGANDGMMHAFNSDNGNERWAYIPSMVLPNMWKLADTNYSTGHINLLNASPVVTDVCMSSCTDANNAVWKTILISGLNGGGRGYFALDVTDPSNPSLLWELTTTSQNGSVKDDDVGFSFGNPIVTRKSDGTWVILVTSGYNNVSPGSGVGYLYALDPKTGAILSKISTGVGSTSTPSGLAKFAAWNNAPDGNESGYVYGGDLLGNLWRFNINDTSTTASIGKGSAFLFATLFADTSGSSPQPITTTPILGKISGSRVIFIGTGQLLQGTDIDDTQTQSYYAIKDDDKNVTLNNPRTSDKIVKQTIVDDTASNTGSRVVTSPLAVNFYTERGWMIDFPVSKERVNVDGLLVQGVLVIPTTVPSGSACSPGGYSNSNFFNYKTGGSYTSTGLVSLRFDSVIMGAQVLYTDGKGNVQGTLSDGSTGNLLPEPVTGEEGKFSGKRTLWREFLQ